MDKTKAISLDQQTENIRREFRAEFESNNQENQLTDIWVIEVFEDHVIIESSGDLFKVGFTQGEEEIEFSDRSEWVEVEKQIDFVEKSIKAFIHQTGRNALKSISKTTDELRVGNYIVLFGDENTRDLENEFFTKSTNFQSSYTDLGSLYVDWEHGHGHEIPGEQDGPGKHDVLGVVDWSTAKIDDRGVWAVRVLDRRNKYMEYIEPMIEANLIGTSSKAIAPDTVISEKGQIINWPLERDTLTVMPAETRMMSTNQIGALKSLVKAFPHLKDLLPKESGDSAQRSKAKEKPKTKKQPLEVKSIMLKTKEDFLNFYAEKSGVAVADLDDKQKGIALNGTEFSVEDVEPSVNPRMDTLEASMKSIGDQLSTVLKYAQDTPAISNVGYYISKTGGKSDKHIFSLGDFLTAVGRDDRERLKTIYNSQYDEGSDAEKADMSHIDGVAGGFLLPVEFENNLLALANEMTPIRDLVTVVPIGSNRGDWPTLDQFTAPTAGVGDTAFAGQVTAKQTAENTALTETRPLFKQIQWNIHKVGGFVQAPNELINDSPQAIETLLEALFVMTIAAKREHYIFRGTGANEPLGILNADALINVSPASDNTFKMADALNMLSVFKPYLSRGSWWMHPGVIPDLGVFEVGTGGSVWLQDQKNDPVINQPLLGKPVHFSEHLPQDDNSGDVILIDPKAYLLFERQGMQIAFSEHFAFSSDQGTWRFTQRMDGQPWLTDAVTLADPQGSYQVSPFVSHND